MNRYKAIAYHSQFDEGRESGEIYVQQGNIHFVKNDISLSMPILSAKIEGGGTAGRQIFITSPNVDFKFSTTDITFLKEPALQNQKIQKQAASIFKQKTYAKIALGTTAVLFVAFIGLLFYYKANIVSSIANTVPFSIEKKIGSTFMSQLTLTQEIDSTSEAVRVLREKLGPLLKLETIPYQIFIAEDESINAFAVPGGYLVFNKGLLEAASKWEEVLGVAGHEMAHVSKKHFARGIISSYGWTTLFSFLLGDGGALTDILFSTTAKLESLTYSRDFESEADAVGVTYLDKAGIDPAGMIDFFKILEKEEGPTKLIPQFLSTHPVTTNRIQNIEKLIEDLDSKKYAPQSDYLIFKTLISPSQETIKNED
ncbi:MAG: M48 family metallopeptidase [Saprospiraceae bacterium]